MSAYKEFSGKTVEEALRLAREDFGAGLEDLDFEILTPGSRGVLGMGAEPARIVAAPRAALGGAAPKRDAAAATPLPPRPATTTTDHRAVTTDRPVATTGPAPRRSTAAARRSRPAPGPRQAPQVDAPVEAQAAARPRGPMTARPAATDRPPRRDDRGPRRDDRDRGAMPRRWPDRVRGGRGGRRARLPRLRARRARGRGGLARGTRRRQGDPRAADDAPRASRSRSRSTPARRVVSTWSATGTSATRSAP